MHILLKSNTEELAREFGFEGEKDSKLFEFFCNFIITSKHYLGRFNPKDVTSGDEDASIDGFAIIIDGDLVSTVEDAEAIFDSHKTNFQVDLVLSQVKSGESFSKAEISNFKLGIDDFLSLNPQLPNGEINKNALEVLKVVLHNGKKVRNRRPNAYVYYCTSGSYRGESEIEASFSILRRSIEDTDLFASVAVSPLGRAEILELWSEISEKNEARMKLIEYFGMPTMPNIPQSYVGIVSAAEFVDKVLCNKDGVLKKGVFDENVRSFLGDDNDVNKSIAQTIQSTEKRFIFSVLNNGITIVAPEMTLTPNSKEIELTNYQIINGCQTSNTLYANRDQLVEGCHVVVKFIQSPQSSVSIDIIAATNNQSDIPAESFHGLKKKAKLVQKYFEAENNDAAPENRVYFERREKEYIESGIPAARVFNVRELSRCYAAMFLSQPQYAARYAQKIFSVSGDSLFQAEDQESLYYASALTLYKYTTLINNANYKARAFTRYRWHISLVFRWLVHGSTKDVDSTSKKANAYAKKIVTCFESPSKEYLEHFENAQSILEAMGLPSDAILKTARFTNELRTAVDLYLDEVRHLTRG